MSKHCSNTIAVLHNFNSPVNYFTHVVNCMCSLVVGDSKDSALYSIAIKRFEYLVHDCHNMGLNSDTENSEA